MANGVIEQGDHITVRDGVDGPWRSALVTGVYTQYDKGQVVVTFVLDPEEEVHEQARTRGQTHGRVSD